MRRHKEWMRWVDVVALLTCPATGSAGWITLSSVSAGRPEPADRAVLWFGSAPTPRLGLDSLSGVGTIQAATGGGTAFLSALGLPVLFDLSDGTVVVSGGTPPNGASATRPDGAPLGSPAATAPRAGGAIPDDTTRFGLALDPDLSGRWTLTATVLGPDGTWLGSGAVPVPEGGGWVLGLGAEAEPAPPPVPAPAPVPTPEPTLPPAPVPGVPEPGTLALALAGAALLLPGVGRRVLATRGR